MSMISPVTSDYAGFSVGSGRPLSDRTMEIAGELQLAKALGKYVVVLPLVDDEVENRLRFSQRSRRAAKLLGMKVRARRLDDGRGELVLLSR